MATYSAGPDQIPLPEQYLLSGHHPFTWKLENNSPYPGVIACLLGLPGVENFLRFFLDFADLPPIETDPGDILGIPLIDNFSDQFLELTYQPSDSIQLNQLYWLHEPDVLLFEIKLINLSQLEQNIKLGINFQVNPSDSRNKLQPPKNTSNNHLSVQISDYYLSIFMPGDTNFQDRYHPRLERIICLNAWQTAVINIHVAVSRSEKISRQKIHQAAQTDFQTKLSKKKIADQKDLTISTGNEVWDFALAYSINQAGLYLNNQLKLTQSIQLADPVMTSWEGLVLLDCLVPIQESQANGILNVLSAGFDYERPTTDNAVGVISSSPPLPFGAEILTNLDQMPIQKRLRRRYLNKYLSSLERWYLQNQDQDEDQIPEIPNIKLNLSLELTQTANTSPLSVPGTINSYLESPAISSLLYNEYSRLDELLQQDEFLNLDDLKSKKGRLYDHIASSWNSDQVAFLTRDRDSHLAIEDGILDLNLNTGFNVVRFMLDPPTRMGFYLKILNQKDQVPPLDITIHGTGINNQYRIERLSEVDFFWDQQVGWGITEEVYSRLDFLNIACQEKFELILVKPGTHLDHILDFLLLWCSNLPSDLVEKWLNHQLINSDKYWSNYGLRDFPGIDGSLIQWDWNIVTAAGLARSGYNQLAANIITNLLSGVSENLVSSGLLFRAFNPESGIGVGIGSNLEGIIPAGLILKLAGIRIDHRGILSINGNYPFDWTLTIQIREIIIQRSKTGIIINMPGEKPLQLAGSDGIQMSLH